LRIWLRDQAPLHRGNIALESGFTFEDHILALNSRVYFWPGNDSGPIDYGRRHFERYRHEDVVVLVMPLVSTITVNPGVPPELSSCNSGSPRCNPHVPGNKALRGPSTFRTPDRFEGTASEVVEVTFAAAIRLPESCKVTHVSDWI
jgi:hypothetical protein